MGNRRSKIVYEDETILVVHKPAGMATQTAKVGCQDVASELKNYLVKTAGAGKSPYLGIVHRLDQPVEGLLVFAKEKRAAAALTAQLTVGGLNKHYYAIVCGYPVPERGTLVDSLVKEGTMARVVGQGENCPGARRAVLHYQVRYTDKLSGLMGMGTEDRQAGISFEGDAPGGGEDSELSLVDVQIDTGRFHQIRAQMSHAGYPLLGDVKYGTDRSLACSRRLGVRQVALCAYRLEFSHPVTKEKKIFEVKPEGWQTYPWFAWDKCF